MRIEGERTKKKKKYGEGVQTLGIEEEKKRSKMEWVSVLKKK